MSTFREGFLRAGRLMVSWNWSPRLGLGHRFTCSGRRYPGGRPPAGSRCPPGGVAVGAPVGTAVEAGLHEHVVAGTGHQRAGEPVQQPAVGGEVMLRAKASPICSKRKR